MAEYDVVIVGGGPGGATLAACLAKRGRKALVLERERFPRFHIGESLLPRSCEVFQELGLSAELDARFIRKHGARFHCSETKRSVRYDFSEAFDPAYEFAYQVPRAEFDDLLLKNAAALGAEVREEWVATEVVLEGTRAVGVRAKPTQGSNGVELLRAPIIVDATGRDTLFASRAHKKERVPELDKTALFSHYRGVPREPGKMEGDIDIVVFEHGWFWFIPFRGEVTSVGAVVSSAFMKTRAPGEPLGSLFDRAVMSSSIASEKLRGAECVRPVGALADFSYRIDRLAGDGWLFVGDAGGFLDPLFSTGAHLAIKGAATAAGFIDVALAKGDASRAEFEEYEVRIRYAIDLFLGVVQGFYRGPVQDMLFDDNQRPTMRKLITSILSGDVFHATDKPTWAGFVQAHYPARMLDLA